MREHTYYVGLAHTRFQTLEKEKVEMSESFSRQYWAMVTKQRELLRLMYESDVTIIADDGKQAPAMKSYLVAASAYFAATFAEHTAEAQNNELQAAAPIEAVRFLLAKIHDTGNVLNTPLEPKKIMDICELATHWQLDQILAQFTAELTSINPKRVGTDGWCDLLVKSEQHIDVESAGPAVVAWRRVREFSMQMVSRLLPASVQCDSFRELPLNTVCELDMTMMPTPHATLTGSVDFETANFEVPALRAQVPIQQGFFDDGLACLMPVTVKEVEMWLPEGVAGMPSVDLSAIKGTDGRVAACARIKDLAGHWMLEGAFDEVHVATSDGVMLRTSARRKANIYFQSSAEGVATTPIDPAPHWDNSNAPHRDKVLRFGVKFTWSARQCRYWLLNRWLLASGRTQEVLSPAVLLAALRGCAKGFDFAGADVPSLQRELQARSLPESGSAKQLAVRLRDAMFVAEFGATGPLAASPVAAACKDMANYIAGNFTVALANDGESIFDLDAVSFSDLLSCPDLKIDSESMLLEHVIRWSTRAGRSTAMLDLIWPLVRLPLLPSESLLRPSSKLRELMRTSEVIRALVTEAIEMQMDAYGMKTPGKRRLVEGEVTVPRNVKRKHCMADEVGKIDGAKLAELALLATR